MKGRFFTHWILPLLIAVGAIFVAYWFIAMAPKAKPKPAAERTATIVEVIKPEYGSFAVEINTMGEVIPSKSLLLTSRVSGEVTAISPNLEAGGIISKGELLAKIDDRDYQLIKQQREANVQNAKSALLLEHGKQIVAKNDLKLLNRAKKFSKIQLDLALRKPQQLQAQAELAKAKASLNEANLAIERTRIYAPWDAIVIERNISVGSNINTQQSVASLIDYKQYYIKASIPADKLVYLNNGIYASKAIIISKSSNKPIAATLLNILPSLDNKSRLAQVLISVDDPLGIDSAIDDNIKRKAKTDLIVNDFVQVKVVGIPLENIFRIHRSHVRDGNTAWVMRDKALVIISAKPVHEDRDYIYSYSDIKADDLLVISNLATPVSGMKLATAKNQADKKQK